MKNLILEFISAIWEVIKLPFYMLIQGGKRFFSLSGRKILMLVIAAGVVLFISSSAFFKATSHPNFCGSCHIMRPYIDDWSTSSHAGIDCMKCHAHEGLTGFVETKFTALSMLVNYATGVYKRSKPWAEIEDSNCLQCHDTKALDGQIDFAGVKFDHTPHLDESRRGRKLRCTSCHSQIVQGEHISVTSTTCFLCHFKNTEQIGRSELSSCQKCHTDPKQGEVALEANSFDHSTVIANDISCNSCHQKMWQGSGLVREERCGVCHSQTAHIDRIEDLEFVHEWHIEKRKIECTMCHDPIEHYQPEPVDFVGGNCAACHDSPHESMLAIYQGTGSRLISEPMPDVMFRNGVVCQSCHKEPKLGHSIGAITQNACTPCHNASYLKLAHNWRESFTKRIATLENAIRKGGTHAQIEDARHDLALLRKGGAWHNPQYAETILNQVADIVEKTSGIPRRTPAVPKASQECFTCHLGISEVDVSIQWSSFNHREHFIDRQIACTECHMGGTPDMQNHGKRKPIAVSCSECHHNNAPNVGENSCTPCHEPSRRLFTGEINFKGAEQSPMAEAGMSCVDCHSANVVYNAPDVNSCLECHDEEIISDLDFKRGELVNALKALKSSKASATKKLVQMDRGRAVHHPDLAKKILKDNEEQ